MLRSSSDAQSLQCDRASHGRAKQTGLFFPFCSYHLCLALFCFFFFFCHGVTAANDGGGCGIDSVARRALACAPSLNSPRSNLQTAAEFWQILPRCFLPLGDTFFIYFPSPPLWYSVHGALAPRAIVSSVLCPCLKNQMDLQGLLSIPPFMNMAQSHSSSLIFIPSSRLWRRGHYSSGEELLCVFSRSLSCRDFYK